MDFGCSKHRAYFLFLKKKKRKKKNQQQQVLPGAQHSFPTLRSKPETGANWLIQESLSSPIESELMAQRMAAGTGPDSRPVLARRAQGVWGQWKCPHGQRLGPWDPVGWSFLRALPNQMSSLGSPGGP